jgi:tRNA-binding protein
MKTSSGTPATEPSTIESSTIAWADFERVELRAGTIIRVEGFPEARHPAWRLWVDLGEELGVRTSSAQITTLYDEGDLVGRQVLCVTNFPPKQIGPFLSEVLVTGFVTGAGVVLAGPERSVPNGARLA